MKRLLKWLGIALGTILIILIAAVAILSFLGNRNLNQTQTGSEVALTVPTDEASIERGKHIVHALAACTSCHGANLEGEVFIDGMPIGVVVASNLTTGAGGVGSTYTDETWIQALRYGVGADGKALLPMMPSDSYHALSDADLGATIAYIKSVPPVDNQLPETALAFPGKIIMGVLAQGDFWVNKVAEADAPSASKPSGATIEHGEYLVSVGSCRHCHGGELNGGQVDPEALPGPNLTPRGHLGEWAQEDFVNAFRTGLRPDGSPIDPFMPWPKYSGMTDEEIEAIWLYLESLEPLDSAIEG